MPLGDVDETLLVLIQGNPRLDIRYVRRRGNREMVLDTRDVREILGDIPLGAPEVLRFLRDYLRERAQMLLAGQEEAARGESETGGLRRSKRVEERVP
jgi:hypothetical protein